MRQQAPTSTGQISTEAWTAMRDAAQRAGLPLDQWLRAQLFGAQALTPDPASPETPGSVADLHRRVQELASQIEQLAERPPEPAYVAPLAATAPGHSPAAYAEAKLEAAIRHINQRMSEINAPHPHAPEPYRPDMRAPDMRATEMRSTEIRPSDVVSSASFEHRLNDLMREAAPQPASQIAQPYVAPAYVAPSYDARPLVTPNAIETAVAEIAARQSQLDRLPTTSAPREQAVRETTHRELAPRELAPREPAAREASLREPLPRPKPAYTPPERSALAPERPAPVAPVVNESLVALQRELEEMRGSLAELAPRKAVADLQRTVSSLTDRVERSGAGNEDIRLTLNALRETIGSLRLPEHGAVVTGRIDTLARKIDILNAKAIDAATIARLQAQCSEIRDLLARTLSADSVQRLAEQVALLAGKIADMSGAQETIMRSLVSPLEQRIERLTDRVEAHRASLPVIPVDDIFHRLDAIQLNLSSARREPPAGMDAMFQGLTDRINRIEQPINAATATANQQFEALSRQIASLAGKLEQVGTPSSQITGQLSGIERTLNDLFIQVEETRATIFANSGTTPRPPGMPGPGLTTAPQTGNSLLKREMAAIEASRASAMASAAAMKAAAPASQPPRAAAIPVVPSAPVAPPAPAAADAFEPTMMRAALEELVRTHTVPAAPVMAEQPASPPPVAPIAPAFIETPLIAPQAEAEPRFEREALRGKPDPLDDELEQPVDLDMAYPRIEKVETDVEEIAPERVEFIARARRATQTASPVLPSSHHHIGHRQQREKPRRWLARIRATLLIGLCGSALAFGSWHLLGAMRQSQLQAQGTPAGNAVSSLAARLGIPQPAAQGSGDITGSIGKPTVKPAAPAPQASPPPVAAPAPVSAPQPSSMSRPADLPGSIGTPTLRAAALAGEAGAAYEIAHLFLEGNGVAASPARAAEWFAYAAAQGSVPAAYRLGAIYEKGMADVPRDVARARQLYEQAALAGNVRAMHNLGVLLAAGVDGQPDYRGAAQWFTRAAERGVRDSQYNLAVLYARGFGVAANLGEAWQWFSLAAANGDNEAAIKRDDIARRLDAQTLATARASLEGWSPVVVDAKANSGSGIELDNPMPRKTASR